MPEPPARGTIRHGPRSLVRVARTSRSGAGPLFDLRCHDPLSREGQHLADEVAISLLLNQLDQRHSIVG
ncbi:hypothetical protein [Rhodovulum sp. ES.010]|uniref:hypothetical protein n=1 Tax=Rhodovulum sp. ES.010 TaxID=1882821 RepID=UPI0009F87A88|nr:hypothetical protein [Rhodovulum sp. ES.010]